MENYVSAYIKLHRFYIIKRGRSIGSVTIDDVAKLAHVSTATVSRILNKKGYVSEETVKKVQQAVEALNYTPKFAARQLASNETKTGIIGAIFASRKTNFYQDELFYTIIQGIGDIVDDFKYNLLVSHVDGSRVDPFESLPSLISNRMVDGLVVGGIPLESRFIKKIIKLGVPVVVIGNYHELKVPKVIVDNTDGGFRATELLIKLGHRKIGIISGDQSIYPFRDKLLGYKKALREHSIDINEHLIITATEYHNPEEAGYFAAQAMFQDNPDVTALFISDSYFRIGVMMYLQEIGKSVPEDLSIVTYATSQQLKFEAKKFTCINIDEINIGHAAANHLFNMITGKIKSPVNITLSVNLVEGMSSKALSTGLNNI